MRSISLDLVRVTEAAAISASKWVGSGDKLSADKAATDAMRDRLNRINFTGKILIGEGEKDKSYGLFSGEKVGSGDTTQKIYEIAVDPIEGTTPTVNSGPEAISVLALSEENSLYTTDAYYMLKLAQSEQIFNNTHISIDMPLETIVSKAAAAIGKTLDQFVVCILNRPRHTEYIKILRKLGVKIKLIQDCDVSGAVATGLNDSGVDILYGIGGAPEAVISAAAIKCMRGQFQAKIARQPEEKDNHNWIIENDTLNISDLVKKDCVFVATGITNGSILRGVRHSGKGYVTNSVFMRSESGTIRWITTEHGN